MLSTMKVSITDLGASGEGVGSLPDGKKIFVEGALPGELVEIEIVENKKSYCKGKLLSLLEKSPHRRHPPCPLFGDCGGCHLQHLSYEEQLCIKNRRVQEALRRLAHIDVKVQPTIPSPIIYNYRNKIQLPLLWKNGEKTIGLFRKHSHEIIPLDNCYIHCEKGEEIFKWIKKNLITPIEYLIIRNGVFTSETLVLFVGNNDLDSFAKKIPHVEGVVQVSPGKNNVILGRNFRTLHGRSYIYEELDKKRFKISAPAFFQVNSWQANNLFRTAITLADIQKNETVLDAYCGVGTLSLFAAEKAKKVIGVDVVPEAIEDARENAQMNKITNCEFRVGRAEQQQEKPDVLFLNPPRKGCETSLLERCSASKIVYISCDPATLARDLALLYNYHIDLVQPLDMFPQTTHVETVVRLTKK
ncbi:MAG: 23S rRNA (uracil(1939)-C(5))-methyltransferase RlmD [Chlamydiales bacterium]